MKNWSPLILFSTAFLLFYSAIFLEQSSASTADTAQLQAFRSGSKYIIEYDVSVSQRRLILIGVIDAKGNGHRVFRYFLNSGRKQGTITIKESRFGKLNRACIAVHGTGSNTDTVVSDCDYF